jgi:hypothetical protein
MYAFIRHMQKMIRQTITLPAPNVKFERKSEASTPGFVPYSVRRYRSGAKVSGSSKSSAINVNTLL